VSATDRVTEALRLARDAQPSLNAFTEFDDERALTRADSLDAGSEGGIGPLAGAPIGLKDLIDHRDRVTTCGSAFYRETASRTAPAVQRLEDAGAVVVGRTGLHEFAFGFSSENPHFGPVRNPWDTDTSPGGSSGGSGAAVGAGITPIAIGTDTGGSVRVPAALCGCFGLKVTYGRVPLDGVFPLVGSIDTVGPLADSIDHIDIAYRAMSGDDTSEPPPTRLRIGIPQPWYDEAPLEEEVDTAFTDVVARLADLGHVVHQISMPDILPGREVIFAIAEEVTSVHAGYISAGLPYGDEVRARLLDCAAVTDEEMARGREWQLMVRDRFGDAFDTVDLLLTPTVPAMRKQIGEDLIGDRHYRTVLSWFTSIVNHALHPAIAMPLSNSAPGRPAPSLQAIGRRGEEALLIAFGRQLVSAGLVGFVPANVQPG
jgi:aspartyl-tRNA(Asn)/glutamyl-tRNA(Gln) amidotransferase subunit A